MDSKTYRNLIGQFATGVTVITSNVDGCLHGMTASAVASVSLDPILLLVCVDHGSNCYQQLARATHFGVNVLREGQDAVSNKFATRHDPERNALAEGVEFEVGHAGVPLLADCLVRFVCRTTQRQVAGDHTIFIGEVQTGDSVTNDAPLIYWNAAYHSLT